MIDLIWIRHSKEREGGKGEGWREEGRKGGREEEREGRERGSEEGREGGREEGKGSSNERGTGFIIALTLHLQICQPRYSLQELHQQHCQLTDLHPHSNYTSQTILHAVTCTIHT